MMSLTEDEKKKSGRKKQASPPYLQTEQLVRTALNQGMLAKDIAIMCRVDSSAINGWKNGRVKAPTHVIKPLIEMFGYSVNRHQLHHFYHFEKETKIEKIFEVRGSLIYSWDFKEVYDIDERSIYSKRSNLRFSLPKLKDVVMSKVYLYHQKPNKFIVLIAKPYMDVSTVQSSNQYNDIFLKLHIADELPNIINIKEFKSCDDAANCIFEHLQRAKYLSNNLLNFDKTSRVVGQPIHINEKCYLYINESSFITKGLINSIGLFYLKQYRNAQQSLFRQLRLHGLIDSSNFLECEVEVI